MFFSCAPKQAGKRWDPDAVLEITNPATGEPTCLGHAVSRGRRCQRYIGRYKTQSVFRTLDELAGQDAALAATKSDRLVDAISTGLCWQHTGDLGMVLGQWTRKLQELQPCTPPSGFEGLAKNYHGKPHFSGSPFGSHPTPGSSPFSGNTQSSLPKFTFRASVKNEPHAYSFSGSFGSVPFSPLATPPATPPRDDQGIKREDASDALREQMRKMQEEIEQFKKTIRDMERAQEEERLRREQKEEQRRERERQASEAERRREEEQRQKQEQEERQRREEEERRRRREEEARQKREEETRQKRESERMREQARRAAEESKRAERQEWATAWSKYAKRWEDIQGKNTDEVTIAKIPWPVKSGRWEDVTSDNVKAFFRKAPPVQTAANAAEERFLNMTKESKRWHTDKILSRFGAGALSGEYKDGLNMIAKLVVELWRQTKEQRRC